MMVMELTNRLEKTFGSLSKTLFFEYQTIQELTGYFLETHREQLIELLGIEEKTGVTKETRSIALSEPETAEKRSLRKARFAARGGTHADGRKAGGWILRSSGFRDGILRREIFGNSGRIYGTAKIVSPKFPKTAGITVCILMKIKINPEKPIANGADSWREWTNLTRYSSISRRGKRNYGSPGAVVSGMCL